MNEEQKRAMMALYHAQEIAQRLTTVETKLLCRQFIYTYLFLRQMPDGAEAAKNMEGMFQAAGVDIRRHID